MSKQFSREEIQDPENLKKALGYFVSKELDDPLLEMDIKFCIDTISSQVKHVEIFQKEIERLLLGGAHLDSAEPYKKKELKAFLYYLIGNHFRGVGGPQRVRGFYCAKLSYEAQSFVMRHRLEKISQPERENFLEYSYYYARYLETAHPNSKQKFKEANTIYSFIASHRKNYPVISKTPIPLLLAEIKLAIADGKTFEEIKTSLKRLKSKEVYRLIAPFIDAEEAWVDLCSKALPYKAADGDKKLQKFFAYIKKKSLQEFNLLPGQIDIAEEEKTLLTPEKLDELIELAIVCELLRNAPLLGVVGCNDLVSVNKTAEILRIVASTQDYPDRYLKCLAENDNEALYDFYLNYGARTSEKSRPQYEGAKSDQYSRIAENESGILLEAAAWSGNAKAQYELANKYLDDAITKQAEITQEQDPAKKESMLKGLGSLRVGWENSLFLAANNEHAQAKFELANALTLGYDESNHGMVNCIISEDKGLAYFYYLTAYLLGHEDAQDKYFEEISKMPKSEDLAAITPEGFEFLRIRAPHDLRFGLLYAQCFASGYGVEKDTAKAAELYKSLYDTSDTARFLFAVTKFQESQTKFRESQDFKQLDFSEFATLIRNPLYRGETISFLEKILADDEILSHDRFLITCALKDFYTQIPKPEKPQFSSIGEIIRVSFATLSAQGELGAQIEMVKNVISETQISDNVEEFDRRQNALSVMIRAMALAQDDVVTKVKIAEQIVLLLKNKSLLPINFSVARVEPFLRPDFLQHKIGSKAQFDLAESIANLVERESEQEKDVWREQIPILLKLSARSTNPCLPAQIKLVSRFIGAEDSATIDELQEIKKWYKSNGIKEPLAMARRIYQVGSQVEEPVQQEYLAEFLYYFNLAIKSQKDELQTDCVNWAEAIANDLQQKAPAVAVAAKKPAVVAKTTLVEALPAAVLGVDSVAGQGDVVAKKVENAVDKGGTKTGEKSSKAKKGYDKKRERKDRKMREEREAAAAAFGEAEDLDSGGETKELGITAKPITAEPIPAEIGPTEPIPAEPASIEISHAELSSSVESLEPKTPPADHAPLKQSSAFSVDALPFIPKKEMEYRQQMIDFLAGSRQIKSTIDLPIFLQENLTRLFRVYSQEFVRVLLKGSALYSCPSSIRTPNDLDIEIIINKMSSWSKDFVKLFISSIFDINMSKIDIYLGPNNDGSEFTVNAKYETRKLDLCFYSNDLMPPIELSWITSREPKILLDQMGGAHIVTPIGIEQHLQKYRVKNLNFFINPFAHDLILRLCFLNTIGEVEFEEMEGALEAIGLKNPIDLLLREFKIEGIVSENLDAVICSKISAFMETRALDDNLQLAFVENLLRISELDLPKAAAIREEKGRALVDVAYNNPDLYPAVRKAISGLREGLAADRPASNPNLNTGAALPTKPLLRRSENYLGNGNG